METRLFSSPGRPKMDRPARTSAWDGQDRGRAISRAAAMARAVAGPGMPSGVTFTAAWTADHISWHRSFKATAARVFGPGRPSGVSPKTR